MVVRQMIALMMCGLLASYKWFSVVVAVVSFSDDDKAVAWKTINTGATTLWQSGMMVVL